MRIGLVPKLALPRIVSAGNVAGEGAKIAALSLRERAEADSILREVEYVELSGRAGLQRPVHRPARVPGMSAGARSLACGALALDVRAIARRRGWDVDVLPVGAAAQPPGADRPGGGGGCATSHDVVAVAYGDCGTQRRPRRARATSGRRALLRRPRAPRRSRSALDAEPGTYFLTDFLARTFEHTVVRELGLDRWPELRDDYFRHYTRVVWLAQRPTPPPGRAPSAPPPARAAADRARRRQRRPGARAGAACWPLRARRVLQRARVVSYRVCVQPRRHRVPESTLSRDLSITGRDPGTTRDHISTL